MSEKKEKKLTYLENVKALAERHDKFEIPNSITKQAGDVLAIMVNNSKEKINIFEGKLDEKIYGNIDFLVEIVFLLEHYNGKVTVVVNNQTADEIKETTFYKKLKSYKVLQNCQFYVVKNDSEYKEVKRYFQTADKSAYREEKDKEETRAIVNFNDRKKVKKFNSDFNKILNESILVSV